MAQPMLSKISRDNILNYFFNLGKILFTNLPIALDWADYDKGVWHLPGPNLKNTLKSLTFE